MRIVCVDDEPLVLDDVMSVCKNLSTGISVKGFTDAYEALEWIRSNPADIVLLDIDMPRMNGITLAARIKKTKPDIVILFLTAYKKYAFDAFQVHPNGYLLKPLEPQVLQKEIDYVISVRPQTAVPHIEAHTFGNFDLLVDGVTVQFKRSKSKEMLAYLIDRRGASCTSEEIAAALWEDEDNMKNLKARIRILISDLKKTLGEIGMDDLIIRRTGQIAVRREMIDCDYYRMLDGDIDAANEFKGDYMLQYSWAEVTAGQLSFRM